MVQGNATVKQYATRFMSLGRFALHLIATKKMQAQKFQVGLQLGIRSHVACFRIKNFQELVNIASIVEAGQRNASTHINLERKRASPFTTGRSSDKRRMMPGINKGKDIITAPPTTFQK